MNKSRFTDSQIGQAWRFAVVPAFDLFADDEHVVGSAVIGQIPD